MRRGYFKDLPSVSRIVAVFFGLVLSLACTDGRHPDHVVLISIDGFRPEFYQDASWPAPMIQQMAQEAFFSIILSFMYAFIFILSIYLLFILVKILKNM